MSHLMGKPTICIGENKDADQLRGNREADQRLVFATRIVQFLFYLNPKFQASSSFLRLYRPVCVGPGRKPHCWFSPRGGSYFHKYFSDQKGGVQTTGYKWCSAGSLPLHTCPSKVTITTDWRTGRRYSASSGKCVREMYTPLNPT